MLDLILTVWAPLFVGSGSSYTKKEYMYNNRDGMVSFFNEQKFFNFLVERDLVEKYSQFMLDPAARDLWKFLTQECGIPYAELEPLTRYKLKVQDALDAKHSLKEIHAFQRDAYDRAYIPGSSVKGALRTAWLLDAILDDSETEHTLSPDKRASFPEAHYVNLLHLNAKRAEDAVNSIFRGIQISDSAAISDKCMMLAGKIDANTNGGTHSINLCRECVMPGTRIRFRLTLDQSVLKGRITQETLQKVIRRYDAYYQQTYGRKFTPPADTAPLPQQPYLILGGGSGFFAKSLAYPYLGEKEGLRWTAKHLFDMRAFKGHKHEQDVDKGISPHTMKYARYNNRFYPYGYCGVSME